MLREQPERAHAGVRAARPGLFSREELVTESSLNKNMTRAIPGISAIARYLQC